MQQFYEIFFFPKNLKIYKQKKSLEHALFSSEFLKIFKQWIINLKSDIHKHIGILKKNHSSKLKTIKLYQVQIVLTTFLERKKILPILATVTEEIFISIKINYKCKKSYSRKHAIQNISQSKQNYYLTRVYQLG